MHCRPSSCSVASAARLAQRRSWGRLLFGSSRTSFPTSPQSGSDEAMRAIEEQKEVEKAARAETEPQGETSMEERRALNRLRRMASRPARVTHDCLTETNSYLLKLALADYLPQMPPLSGARSLYYRHRRLGFQKIPYCPPGHHLLYFNPQLRERELLPDGTDRTHWPGHPFTRRMWAGGSLLFHKPLVLGDWLMKCRESVADCSVRGGKVFVELNREYLNLADEKYLHESRTLVFLKPNTPETASDPVKAPRPPVKVPFEPEFSVELKPSPALLFRFSALTYNAHAIHLNPQYCREVEGYRNLLVHGPLSLVLMLTALNHLMMVKTSGPDGHQVRSFQYRNLAPLFADESMKVCVRPRDDCSAHTSNWDVWIEGPDGNLAVKATAVTSRNPGPSAESSEDAHETLSSSFAA